MARADPDCRSARGLGHDLPGDRDVPAPGSAALRRTGASFPAGLLLLAVRRSLPHGEWWWKSGVLGALNFGLFFPLIFLSAYRLPGGLAATVQATLPLAVMALAWPIIHERPVIVRGAALVGLSGVGLLVLRSPESVDPDRTDGRDRLRARRRARIGAGGEMAVLPRPVVRRRADARPRRLAAVTGGLLLLPLALLVEGAPSRLDTAAIAGFLWIGGVGTVVAYSCWFYGLSVLLWVGRPGRTAQPGGGHRARDPLRRRAVRVAPGPRDVPGRRRRARRESLRLAPPGSRRPGRAGVSRSAP